MFIYKSLFFFFSREVRLLKYKVSPYAPQRAKFARKVHKPPLGVIVINFELYGLMYSYGSPGVSLSPKYSSFSALAFHALGKSSN